ncbi:MAG TPA: PTS sugar transporter subunit IIA [Negativicutes bacterium]|nr:PTS sugar transporter subunit IIA [Negativicutes bacterium]
MIKELIEMNRVIFAREFDRWEDAVEAAAQPLIRDGAIDKTYIDSMIECINKYGPYIVIAPDVAMPHAQGGGTGVHRTSMSLMKVEQPVHFSDSPEHDARLLFVLASVDSDAHLDMLQALVEEISDEAFLARLLEIQEMDELKKLVGI